MGTRTPYGVAPNAFDNRFIPGGSSSGSGAAVGGGLLSFALGTDTAGSGRVPAMYNGCVGLKGSLGKISTVGEYRLWLMGRALGHVGAARYTGRGQLCWWRVTQQQLGMKAAAAAVSVLVQAAAEMLAAWWFLP